MSMVANQFETERVSALQSYSILDTPSEPAFDDITRLVALICKVQYSAITFIDRDRQWFKSLHGEFKTKVSETPRNVAFCNHTIQRKFSFVVRDTHKDPRFANSPLVIGPPYVRFYVGMPLLDQNENAIGALCAFDTTPKNIQAPELELLQNLSKHVMRILEERRRSQFETVVQNSLLAVANSVTDGILIEDEGRRVNFCNQAFADIFGYSGAKHLEGKCISKTMKWISMQGVSTLQIDHQLPAESPIILKLTNGKTVAMHSKPIHERNLNGARIWIFRSV